MTATDDARLSPETGRVPGSFADYLLREAMVGGATKQEVIERAIEKYGKLYVKGREPNHRGLVARAHRVFAEAREAGWAEQASSSFVARPPQNGLQDGS